MLVHELSQSACVACVYVCGVKPGDLETIVGERVSALRKLKNNPHDKEALGTIFKVQQQVGAVMSALNSQDTRSTITYSADHSYWKLSLHVEW